MKKTTIIVLFSILFYQLSAQIIYDEIASSKLNSIRELKIKLPKGYNPESEQVYPLIYYVHPKAFVTIQDHL